MIFNIFNKKDNIKSIKNLINESLIREAKARKVGITTLLSMTYDSKDSDYIDPEELLDFDWDEEMVEYFKEHCCIVPPLAGYNGDSSDDWTMFGMSSILKRRVSNPATDVKVKQIMNNPIVSSYLKFSPKLVGFRYVSGYDCPTIICFDEDSNLAKKIILLADDEF